MQELLQAVQDSKVWLNRFTRREYRVAFNQYSEQYAPLFLAAAERAESLDALAEDFLDRLEEARNRQWFWNRSAARVDEKRMMVSYLSPMLLSLEETPCPALAELLQNKWSERWPKDGYRMTSYEELQNGFRNAILGIDLAGKHIDSDLDR